MPERYVARLVVERVDMVPPPGGVRQGVTTERVVSEVASFTVKSKTLEGLKAQLGGHVELVSDEE